MTYATVLTLLLGLAATRGVAGISLASKDAPAKVNGDGDGHDDGADVDVDTDEVLKDFKARMKTAVSYVGSIPIVTVETRDVSPMKLKGTTAKDGTRIEAANPGEGQPWQYYRTKNGLMLKWLQEKALSAPNAIVALVDGGDMVFGGCTDASLRDQYQKTVRASNGPMIVASGEVGCYPPNLAKKLDNKTIFEDRRKDVLAAMGLPEDWVKKWSVCSDRRAGPCDIDVRYRHFNYGFVMGPVKDMIPMWEYVYHDGAIRELDQGRAMDYMLEHPEKVTLDYTGGMVLSMHNMKIWTKSPLSVTTERDGRKVIWNNITKKVQCFAHGNGNAEFYVDQLAIDLAPFQLAA